MTRGEVGAGATEVITEGGIGCIGLAVPVAAAVEDEGAVVEPPDVAHAAAPAISATHKT